MSTPPAHGAPGRRRGSSSSLSSWALLHPCPANEWPAHWGDAEHRRDRHRRWPVPVHRWSPSSRPLDLAAALNITLDAAPQLVADGLELTYRLPRSRNSVQSGRVPVWVARAIAGRPTTWPRGGRVRRPALAATAGQDPPGRRHRLVEEARLYYDPDRAVADEEHGSPRRGVWSSTAATPATTDVVMTLETPDALLFDQTSTHRRRTRRLRRHRRPSTSAGHVRSGSSPTPNTPWTSCPAARRHTHRVRSPVR